MNSILETINEKKYELLLAKDYNVIRLKYKLEYEATKFTKIFRYLLSSGKKAYRKLTAKDKSPLLATFDKYENERQRRVKGDLLKFFSKDEEVKKLLHAYKNYIFKNTKVVKLNESHKDGETIIDGMRYDKNERFEFVIVQKLVQSLAERKFNVRPDVQFVYERFLQDRKQRINEREAYKSGDKVEISYYKNENQYIEGLLLKALVEYSKNKGCLIAKAEKTRKTRASQREGNGTGNNSNAQIDSESSEKIVRTAQELENEKLLSLLPNSVQEYWR